MCLSLVLASFGVSLPVTAPLYGIFRGAFLISFLLLFLAALYRRRKGAHGCSH
jgi:hypothetical protein